MATDRRFEPTTHMYAQTPSTFQHADPAAAEWTTWATLNQTAGRGRRDRTWQSTPGESLAACVLVKPEQGMTWLPLAAGLALVRALRPLVAHPVGVKWPNDVQIEIDGEARKVAGILCEMRDGAVVVGFGVNLVQQADALLPTAVSLRQAGAEGEATALAERVLDGMRAHLRELAGQLGTPALREQIEAECLTLGLDVRAELPGDRMMRGRAVRLDDDGGLVIDTDAGETTVVAGDVVHLRPEAWQSARTGGEQAD
ncbi:biotin--[acetyl-CoA-carboxylase] ligase [Agrococcus casei]|uniref:biotin--[acetyl-CoA-carboxylase] ligase n=1 Tax=Agrococcus casei TaxID=343512 RepID=UPI003F9381AE